ncbi:MAG: sigma-70 family RNA polymerase sigma factor [Deltaproteobacteria bacterium]|nr:sigma-70 family RNA polymerase sigma factor [Deltaproteobacteria bacterium]MDZ4224675.1 sigma-70 family RNA polymerase sigma factor [bacterium]
MAKTALKTKPILGRLKDVVRGKTAAQQKYPQRPAQKPSTPPKLTKKELEELKIRDELIAQHMPYAASIASRVYQSLSTVVEYDEVLCSARLGLLEAAKRFDERMEVDFKTFAYYRVKGAIYDGLRKAGWIPRTLYAKLKFEEAANDYLQFMSQFADSKSKEEPEEGASQTVNSLASIYIISLDSSEDMDVEDTTTPHLEKTSEFRHIRMHMREAINSLPAVEKKLIKMYYFQNKTLEEVGEELHLSKSWTSRLHARALAILLKTVRIRADGEIIEEGKAEEGEIL